MRRIDDIEGRSDDVFTYGQGMVVHPLVFRSRLGSEQNIVEYQVRQTPAGADIAVQVQASIDAAALGAWVEQDLEAGRAAEAHGVDSNCRVFGSAADWGCWSTPAVTR